MLKVKIRKAKPLPFPKLKEGEIMDPKLELERDCTHVCEVEVDGQKTKKFVGNSREEAYRQFVDHTSFCVDAYCEVLFPEKPASPAKAEVIKRQLAHAGFKVSDKLKKASKLPKPPQHLKRTETSKARAKAAPHEKPKPYIDEGPEVKEQKRKAKADMEKQHKEAEAKAKAEKVK